MLFEMVWIDFCLFTRLITSLSFQKQVGTEFELLLIVTKGTASFVQETQR